ncbi:MAG: DUF4388 domain-containing protein [Acidobacteriota bacterium]
MTLEGDLQVLGLPRVLLILTAQSSNGILTVQGEEDIVAVSLLDGAVVAADALNQTVEEGLGQILSSQSLISPEDFSAAVRDHQGGGSGSLGDMLVDRGMISRDELLDALRQQTYQLMLQVLCWEQGEFKFYGGDEISYEDGFVPLSVEELLIRSIDDLAGRGGIPGPVPELDAAYRRVPQRVAPQVLGRDGDGTGDGVWISALQEALMLRVNAQTSAASQASEMNLGRYQAEFALYNLLRHDLIEHLGQPKAAGTLELQQIELDPEPLRAEIFTPPEPGEEAQAPIAQTRAAPSTDVIQRWVGPVLATLCAVCLLWSFSRQQTSVLLPFPWQEGQRGTVERSLRQSLYLKLDRAAKTYFLVAVHYPSSLDEMAELGLISQADTRDQSGGYLAYSTDDVTYRIVPQLDGHGAQEQSTTEAITGDFLLDPQFLRTASSDVPPLYLLD